MTFDSNWLRKELEEIDIVLNDAEVRLIAGAESGGSQANKVRVATDIYMIQSFRKIADALVKSNEQMAEASGRQAKQLVWATWALVVVTLLLVVVTIVQFL